MDLAYFLRCSVFPDISDFIVLVFVKFDLFFSILIFQSTEKEAATRGHKMQIINIMREVKYQL